MSEHDSSFHLNLVPEEPDARECETMRQYLAIWDDLTTEQRRTVAAHVRDCPSCSTEHLAMNRVTQLVSSLEASSPSARVDKAVMEAIAARSKQSPTRHLLPISKQKRRKNTLQFAGLLLAAAAVLVATFASVRFTKTPSSTQAFLLPTTLSWSAYILYHSQTKLDMKGKRYRVDAYHQMASGYLNVETVQQGSVDVVLVEHGSSNLGMDEIKHVAQNNVQGWGIDMSQEAMFDLNELRHELNTHQASYLDTDSFHGTSVYRIRYENGLVLLLDKQYRPVNILAGAVGPGTGEPIYDTVSLLPPTKVPPSMWSMQVPVGFKMGVLPARI